MDSKDWMRDKCPHCGGNHLGALCPELSKCPHCGGNHLGALCPELSKCPHCGGNHLGAVCPTFTKPLTGPKTVIPTFGTGLDDLLKQAAPQPPSEEEKPIQLTLEQSAIGSLVMAALGFILAVWMISTGKLGIGYDASAVNRTIAQAQSALDSLQTERANLEHTIAKLQAVQTQLETQIRTNQREQLKWAVIGALIGFLLDRVCGWVMPKRVRDTIAARPKRMLEWVKERFKTTSQSVPFTKEGNVEQLDHLEKGLGKQFEDAPRELKATINLALCAIQGKEFAEALNRLQQAQNLIDNKDELADWRAKMCLAWALYYCRGGPEPELEPHVMWHSIRRARQLEPENKQLNALIAQIRADSERR